VDGKAVPVYPADLALQALQLPAGRHSVRVFYRDTWFFAGVALSGASLLFLVTIAFCRRRVLFD
jgi:uncharacterized membrane protein YfhO